MDYSLCILDSLGGSEFRRLTYQIYRVRPTESNGTSAGSIACLVLDTRAFKVSPELVSDHGL